MKSHWHVTVATTLADSYVNASSSSNRDNSGYIYYSRKHISFVAYQNDDEIAA